MNRAQAADALARATAFWSSLHAEAEGEVTAAREEAVQLRHALAQEKVAGEVVRAQAAREAVGLAEKVQAARFDLHEYEKTVADLHEKLRAEEARRASYQAVDAAARRFIERFRRENPRAGWKAGWRCPAAEMQALLDAVDPDEGAEDPHPILGP